MSSTADMPVQTASAMPAQSRLRSALLACSEAMEAERDQVVHWAPVMLGMGIAAYFGLPWSHQRLAFAGVAASLVFGSLAIHGAARKSLAWAGLLMLAGFGCAAWRTHSVAAPRLASAATLQVVGRILSVQDRAGQEQMRILLAPDSKALPPRVRISFDRKESRIDTGMLAPGAIVRLRARLSPPALPAYPGSYDFARTSWFEGVGASGRAVGTIEVQQPAPPVEGLAAHLAQLRSMLEARFLVMMPGSSGAVAAALVTGNQATIPDNVVAAMRDSGLAHLLSISGLHIAIVVAGVLWIVRHALLLVPRIALKWPVKLIATFVAALAGIGYTLLAGSEVPAVRACIATLVVLIGLSAGRQALTLRMVVVAATLILAVRPEALLTPGFQLSFAAVVGVVAFTESKFGQWLHRQGRLDGWLYDVGRRLLALIMTGMVAEVMLSATALFHFNRTGLYGALANLLAIPMTGFVIMPLLIVAIMFDSFGWGHPAFWLLARAIDVLTGFAAFVASWPGAVLRLPAMGSPAYGLIVMGGLWMCLWGSRLRWWGLVPILAGCLLFWISPPPDLLVSEDGRHIAILTSTNDLALLKNHRLDYINQQWIDATAAQSTLALIDLASARCNRAACFLDIAGDERPTRLLATRSLQPFNQIELSRACAKADIVISAQRLADWCRPLWLKLDRTALNKTHAIAIWTVAHRFETVGERVGDHPWQDLPPTIANPR